MKGVFLIARQAYSNKIIQFVFSRYFTYLIQFINSLFIAAYLGPYLLGVWGFINLIIQYFSQINFGISHSLNAILSLSNRNLKYATITFNTALSIVGIVAFIPIAFFLINNYLELNIGRVYKFSDYILWVCLIAILNYFISIFQNLFRVFNLLFEIAFSQSILPVLILISIVFFSQKDLINCFIISNLIAFISSLFLFVWKCPVKIKPVFSLSLAQKIIKKGLFLFLYNSSFYLIIISTRSYVSAYFPVEEFGYFTFAFTLANTIFLLFDAFSFLIFPKTLNVLGKVSNNEALKILKKIRIEYITVTHAFVYFAVFVFPIILDLFPEYQRSINSLRLIALTLMLYTNCFGYSSLLISKFKEKELGILAFMTLCLNSLIAYILIKILKVGFDNVIFATTISYSIYLICITFYGRFVINAKMSICDILKDAFPTNVLLPFILCLLLISSSANNTLFITPLILFLALNRKNVCTLISSITRVIKTPNIINI